MYDHYVMYDAIYYLLLLRVKLKFNKRDTIVVLRLCSLIEINRENPPLVS